MQGPCTRLRSIQSLSGMGGRVKRALSCNRGYMGRHSRAGASSACTEPSTHASPASLRAHASCTGCHPAPHCILLCAPMLHALTATQPHTHTQPHNLHPHTCAHAPCLHCPTASPRFLAFAPMPHAQTAIWPRTAPSHLHPCLGTDCHPGGGPRDRAGQGRQAQ